MMSLDYYKDYYEEESNNNNFPELLKPTEKNRYHHCLACKKDLIKNSDMYIVERCIRQYPDRDIVDAMFEYAICLECYEKEKCAISEDSKNTMESFMQENVQLEILRLPFDDKYGCSKCLITGADASTLDELQIVAFCQEGQVIQGSTPMLLSGEAMDQINEVLSNETREYLQRFKDTYLPTMPEVDDILRKHKPVFI